jgi:hypothetical protein
MFDADSLHSCKTSSPRAKFSGQLNEVCLHTSALRLHLMLRRNKLACIVSPVHPDDCCCVYFAVLITESKLLEQHVHMHCTVLPGASAHQVVAEHCGAPWVSQVVSQVLQGGLACGEPLQAQAAFASRGKISSHVKAYPINTCTLLALFHTALHQITPCMYRHITMGHIN